MNSFLWGIDLGGTKIEAVVLSSPTEPEVLVRSRIPTEASRGYEHILGQIKKLIGQVSKEVGVQPVRLGIGTPGAIDPTSHMLKNSNSVVLNGKPFKDDLEKALNIEVVMANDANCFALAETRMGIVPEVMPDARVVFGVIMGTGVGGGLVVDGQVLNGRQGICGEWGHNFLDKSGGPCYCGKEGCVETIISGTGLERYYHQITGEQKRLKEIVQEASEGHGPAKNTIDRLVNYFGRGLAQVVNIVDPDIIILGGGVGNIDNLYTEGKAALKNYIFNINPSVTLAKPKLGDSAGVFGAAFLTV